MSTSPIGSAVAAVGPVEGPNAVPPHNDDQVLRYMRAKLYQHVSQRVTVDGPTGHAFEYLVEPDGRQHRIVLMNRATLGRGGPFAFVGFFGRKRPDADSVVLDELDRELVAEFIDHPQLLSYSSLELADGSWANLVVMSSPEAAMHWGNSARHAYAVREVAPRCYLTIRLHSGVIIAGERSIDLLHIKRTKYFDFEQSSRGAFSYE